MPDDILENCYLTAWFNLALMSTISSSSVAIDRQLLCNYHLIPLTTFSSGPINLAAITETIKVQAAYKKSLLYNYGMT